MNRSFVLRMLMPLSCGLGLIAGLAGGCSKKVRQGADPLPVTPPSYVQVPHPAGLDEADLVSIFSSSGAPQLRDLADCDAKFRRLRALTTSKDELAEGAREFVRTHPVDWHWCFYGKLLLLEERLRSDAVYLEERQKAVTETYLFLSPFGRAFFLEYQDSRYLRWATHRYRSLSERVFFRRVELTPERAVELAVPNSAYSWIRPQNALPGGVLERYGLTDPMKSVLPQVLEASPPTALLPSGLPAQQPSPSPEPQPSTQPSPSPEPSPVAKEEIPPA